MLERIHEFAGLLRRNGVRVSVAEVVDAVRAAELVGMDAAGDVRAALSATVVKKAGDQAVFDELFTLYFLRGGELARDVAGAPIAEALAGLGLDEDQIERILALLADQAAGMSAMGRGALGLRSTDVTPLIRIAGGMRERIVSPLHVGFHTHRLLERMDLSAAERELAQLRTLVAQALGDEAAAALAQALAANLQAIKQAVRRHVQDEFEKQNKDFIDQFRLRTLGTRPLSQLSEDEVQKLRAEVTKLARKLRTQASLRPRIQRRGRLDVRRTIRRSLATGGVPFKLHRRRKRIERPRLVVLCDVSDSVRNASRFLLELVYTLQELFERVRSFVFVSAIGEATELFRTFDIDRAVELALGGGVISVQANSNYGNALEQFVDKYGDAVTSKTTVIVIGDARNNYNPPNAERLSEIRRRAKRLIWLNPELPGAWGFGDSAMRIYEPHCDRVEVAYNLESLRRVVDELVL